MQPAIRLYGLLIFFILLLLLMAQRLPIVAPWNLGYLITFFVCMVSVLSHGLVQSRGTNSAAFVRAYLAATGIRLLVYLLVISLLMYFLDEGKQWVVIFFLINYLPCTGLEIWLYVYHNGRKT